VDDDSQHPHSHKVHAPSSEIRVFVRGDSCVNGYFQNNQPKHLRRIFENCSYIANGFTDSNGEVVIPVPPTTSNVNTDYVVIGKTPDGYSENDKDDDPDARYAAVQVHQLNACEDRDVELRKVKRFDGKCVPAHEDEDWGTHLLVVSPDYMDWTGTVEQYPFIIEAEGTWQVTTSITPPDGFVPDTSQLSTTVTDDTSGMQFTLTDVGSSWTQVGVTHNIVHKGKKIKHVANVKMFDRKGAMRGAGWINSPAGAYPGNPSAVGKFNFGFGAKIDKNGLPKGDVSFDLNSVGLNFDGVTVDSLVITSPKAVIRGTGKLNGVGGYSFLMTGYDSKAAGGSGSDKIRIKILKGTVVVYDNQMGAPDTADPTKSIGDGNIRLPK
jgi:hypothetical protein